MRPLPMFVATCYKLGRRGCGPPDGGYPTPNWTGGYPSGSPLWYVGNTDQKIRIELFDLGTNILLTD
jgi:hypothetical protein